MNFYLCATSLLGQLVMHDLWSSFCSNPVLETSRPSLIDDVRLSAPLFLSTLPTLSQLQSCLVRRSQSPNFIQFGDRRIFRFQICVKVSRVEPNWSFHSMLVQLHSQFQFLVWLPNSTISNCEVRAWGLGVVIWCINTKSLKV